MRKRKTVGTIFLHLSVTIEKLLKKKKKISEAHRLVATFSFRCEFESVSASLSLFLLFILPFLHPFFHVAHVTSARNPL